MQAVNTNQLTAAPVKGGGGQRGVVFAKKGGLVWNANSEVEIRALRHNRYVSLGIERVARVGIEAIRYLGTWAWREGNLAGLPGTFK